MCVRVATHPGGELRIWVDRRGEGEAPLELVSAVVALTLMKSLNQQRVSDLASGSNILIEIYC